MLGVRDQGAHFVEGEDAFGSLVVVAGSLAAFELAHRVDRDAALAVGLGEDDRERP